jgi:hypothetical protein
MNDNECAAAAKQRRDALCLALDATDPDDDGGMRRLWLADRRLSEQCIYLLSAQRPDLMLRVQTSGRVPEREDGGPATAAQLVLWKLCATYEITADLLEIYVDGEKIFTDSVSNLLQDASLN